jgi:hypothetical protein
VNNRFVVTVDAETPEQAEQVMCERINVDEDYGFPYTIAFTAESPGPRIFRVADSDGHGWDQFFAAPGDLTDTQITTIMTTAAEHVKATIVDFTYDDLADALAPHGIVPLTVVTAVNGF